MGTLFLGIVASLLFSIFFSGMEVSFLSANKLQIELNSRQGNFPATIVRFFTLRPTWFLGTTSVGNIASIFCFGIFTTQAIVPWLHRLLPGFGGSVVLPVVVLTAILTIAVAYTVDSVSKSLFVINANTLITVLALPFALISVAVFPVVYLIITLAKFLSAHVFRLEYSMDKPVFGLIGVDNYLRTMHRVRPWEQNLELDKKIFTNALKFRSVRVRDCMIPRTEIVAVRIEDGIRKLHEAFIESGHSKIIIYKESIDDVIGYCHSSALFRKPRTIDEILTPIITVSEATLARELLIKFINERKSLAIVFDEFGGTSGIVSMEDVIEEIFGDIEDEHDRDDLIEHKLDDGTYLLSARLEVDYLNETYGWNLPTGDYETLGGLILSYTEDIPRQGDRIDVNGFRFIVRATSRNRIQLVVAIPVSGGTTN